MTRKSTILYSPHKKLIDDLLNKGHKVSEVLDILKEKGIDVSRSALYRYRNSNFISKRQSNNRLYRILIETGNYNLINSLETTVRIYENKRQCRCNYVRAEDLRRKGRVFIHRVCNGWYPYDLAIHLKNRDRKGKVPTKHHRVSATARSY